MIEGFSVSGSSGKHVGGSGKSMSVGAKAFLERGAQLSLGLGCFSGLVAGCLYSDFAIGCLMTVGAAYIIFFSTLIIAIYHECLGLKFHAE